MGDEINSPSLLISMLMELRQENRQLADELSTAQMLLRALQATAVPSSVEKHDVAVIESPASREGGHTVLAD